MAEGNKKLSELPTGFVDINSLFVADDVISNEYVSQAHTATDVATALFATFAYITSILQTTSKIPVSAINEVQAGMGKILTNTLTAGQTSITFSDSTITDNSHFDWHGIDPTSVTVTTGSITLTCEALSEDIEVKVVIF